MSKDTRLPSKWEVYAYRVDLLPTRNGKGLQMGLMVADRAVTGPFPARRTARLSALLLNARYIGHPVHFGTRRVLQRKTFNTGGPVGG